MKENIGRTDKVIRTILALFFAYLGYAYHPLWYILTFVLALTILTGFCWPYKIFGINTKKRREIEYKHERKRITQSKKPDYKSMTKKELYEKAQKRGIEGRSKMNKKQLIKALKKN